jgi:hypothetical protein
MDAAITSIGFVALGAVVALAIVAVWPRRSATAVVRLDRPSVERSRSGSRSSHQWFGGDPTYFLGGDGGAADCGTATDGGGCD